MRSNVGFCLLVGDNCISRIPVPACPVRHILLSDSLRETSIRYKNSCHCCRCRRMAQIRMRNVHLTHKTSHAIYVKDAIHRAGTSQPCWVYQPAFYRLTHRAQKSAQIDLVQNLSSDMRTCGSRRNASRYQLFSVHSEMYTQ